MDDKKNGEQPRVPEVEDLIKVCKSLNEQGAKYILIGGYAVILNGYVRGTKDIDLLIDTTQENIRKIKIALSILQDNAIAKINDNDVKEYSVVRVADEIVIDLMGMACGIDYDHAKKMVEYYQIEDIQIPVATRELLIKLKDTVRPTDKADVEFLRCSLEEEKKRV